MWLSEEGGSPAEKPERTSNGRTLLTTPRAIILSAFITVHCGGPGKQPPVADPLETAISRGHMFRATPPRIASVDKMRENIIAEYAPPAQAPAVNDAVQLFDKLTTGDESWIPTLEERKELEAWLGRFQPDLGDLIVPILARCSGG